jgi:hypothetical protein
MLAAYGAGTTAWISFFVFSMRGFLMASLLGFFAYWFYKRRDRIRRLTTSEPEAFNRAW